MVRRLWSFPPFDWYTSRNSIKFPTHDDSALTALAVVSKSAYTAFLAVTSCCWSRFHWPKWTKYFSQNFIYDFRNSAVGCHLESRFHQSAIADLIKNGNPYFHIFRKMLLFSILQWFNDCFTHETCIDDKIIMIQCADTELWTKTDFQ